jgi:hypothetical protein
MLTRINLHGETFQNAKCLMLNCLPNLPASGAYFLTYVEFPTETLAIVQTDVTGIDDSHGRTVNRQLQ